jgi:cytochrome bd ubiquinol oxidase subunit II
VLADLPVVFILVGLVAYTVLAGADFGAGFWTLVAGPGRAGRAAAREHARHAMGPVWEANHVWLIFILVVCWTAYPAAFASITSTLAAPLLLAVIGIILRGAAYALRGQLEAGRGRRATERVFALSSVLTPFALGTVVGAIAGSRVPPGNAQGDPVTSWLNPTSIALGVLAVATSAYLAAVYLAADAHRVGERALELDFRARALRAGVCTGVLALVSLVVVQVDAGSFASRLTAGGGLAMVVVSSVGGLGTLALVWRGRFEPARVSAALAVAAIIVGWAFAQQPWILPGLTIRQAAAGRSTLLAVTVVVAIGAVVLVPSLLLLFAMDLRGRFDGGAAVRGLASTPAGPDTAGGTPSRLAVASTVACLALGTVSLVFAESGAAHVIGIACLSGGALAMFVHVSTIPVEGD